AGHVGPGPPAAHRPGPAGLDRRRAGLRDRVAGRRGTERRRPAAVRRGGAVVRPDARARARVHPDPGAGGPMTSLTRPTDTDRPARRRFQPLRDLPAVFWLVAVVVVTLAHREVPAPRWLMFHLLLLGAATHSI